MGKKNIDYLKELSIEQLAKFNVKNFMFMAGYSPCSIYRTSDYSEFNTKEEAIEHEIKWLLSDLDEEMFECQ